MKTYTEQDFNLWKKDNLADLRKEYCELMIDNFNEYIEEQFKLWCEVMV
jgi:hypothetical protein